LRHGGQICIEGWVFQQRLAQWAAKEILRATGGRIVAGRGFVCRGAAIYEACRTPGREPEARLQQQKKFEIRAEWDGEAGMWWCSNDELPLTTEAPTFEQLVSRVLEIAPEIAAENGLAAPGDEIEVHVIAERVQSVPVVAAA
jgi:Domain of unknown function (DUF1902)